MTDVLGCSREVARKRLAELHEQGRVERRKSGRTVLWWRSDDEENPFLRGFGMLADQRVIEPFANPITVIRERSVQGTL